MSVARKLCAVLLSLAVTAPGLAQNARGTPGGTPRENVANRLAASLGGSTLSMMEACGAVTDAQRKEALERMTREATKSNPAAEASFTREFYYAFTMLRINFNSFTPTHKKQVCEALKDKDVSFIVPGMAKKATEAAQGAPGAPMPSVVGPTLTPAEMVSMSGRTEGLARACGLYANAEVQRVLELRKQGLLKEAAQVSMAKAEFDRAYEQGVSEAQADIHSLPSQLCGEMQQDAQWILSNLPFVTQRLQEGG